MAITHQGSNTSYYSTTGTSLTQAIDVGTGDNRLLIVPVFTEYDNKTPTATFNGVAMTRLISQQYDTYHTSRDLHIFVLANPASGSHNFVVTCANSGLITMGYSCYNGVDQTTPTPTTAYGSKGSSTTCEATLTIANSDSWMFATMMTNNGHDASTWGAGTGTTKRGFMFGFSTVQAGCNYDSNGGLATGSRTLVASNSDGDAWGRWIAVEIKNYVASGPAHISSINGVPIANIASRNGVPIANILSINGVD